MNSDQEVEKLDNLFQKLFDMTQPQTDHFREKTEKIKKDLMKSLYDIEKPPTDNEHSIDRIIENDNCNFEFIIRAEKNKKLHNQSGEIIFMKYYNKSNNHNLNSHDSGVFNSETYDYNENIQRLVYDENINTEEIINLLEQEILANA